MLQRKKIIIFGGSGYIGQYVARKAVELGMEVTSLSKSGRPTHPIRSHFVSDWDSKVHWVKGDVLDFSSNVPWKSSVAGQDCAISCIGAFGSDEFMKNLNGHANVNLVKSCRHAGVKTFAYISASSAGHHIIAPYILSGYFDGKKLADDAVSTLYGGSGVILRPGFVYGTRMIGAIGLPLQLIGRPLEQILCLAGLSRSRVFSVILPVNVEDLASAAVAGSMLKLFSATASSGKIADDEKVLELWHDDIVMMR